MSTQHPHSGPGPTGSGRASAEHDSPYRSAEPSGYVVPGSPGHLSPPGPGQQTGQLVLQLKPPPGPLADAMTTPKVTIDGWPVPVRWRTNVVNVPAGLHRIDAQAHYLWDYGRAQLDVRITPGQQTVVHYSSPWTVYTSGTIGHSEQPRRGAWIWWVIAGVALTPLLAVVIFGLIAVVASS